MSETELLKQYEKMINHVALSFVRSGIELEELDQEAKIAFLRACRKWSPDKGASLTTFAYQYMVNDLTKLCRDRYRIKRRCDGMKSLDAPVAADEANLYEFLSARPHPTADIIDAHRLMSVLPKQSFDVVVRVLNEETVRDIGEDLHISKSQVSNVYNAALKRMRRAA